MKNNRNLIYRIAIIVLFIFSSNIRVGLAQTIKTEEIQRILNTLASDEFKGRSALDTLNINKAANFIIYEYKKAGLIPYKNDDFKQRFEMLQSSIQNVAVKINNKQVDENELLIHGDLKNLNWNSKYPIKTTVIGTEDDFYIQFSTIARNKSEDEIIWVNPAHKNQFSKYKQMLRSETLSFKDQVKKDGTKVFILSDSKPENYDLDLKVKDKVIPMSNLVGMIPGKSKPQELVIISGHYDHLGIMKNVAGTDSIANGADDDASGITAVIALANYYKKKNDNARTLMFVSYTAEELGLLGSNYFTTQVNPDEIIAMINIEMIGKDSKFGPNSMYITGYDSSNLGKLMQQNLKGSQFTFYPDPYPQQNLFYRSDNASLAAKGVPAHTFSTVQVDQDPYYHTEKDEVSTLNIQNIKSSIKALAVGAKGIIDGSQTPTRVIKLRD